MWDNGDVPILSHFARWRGTMGTFLFCHTWKLLQNKKPPAGGERDNGDVPLRHIEVQCT